MNETEKLVDAGDVAVAMPQQLALLVGELVVWRVYGKMQWHSLTDELVLPFANYFAAPASHGVVVDR